jgi:hypothetical protein
MADLRAAAQQALEWAESHGEAMFAGGGSQAVEHMNAWTQALRAALAQEEQEPVALCDPAEYDDFQGAVSRNQSASRQS